MDCARGDCVLSAQHAVPKLLRFDNMDAMADTSPTSRGDRPAIAPRATTTLSQSSTVWWWTALVVLVVNDHVLKGAGVLPGWLTGKLSDFAGLIVAPMLAARVVGRKWPAARALAFGVVVAVFAATKIAPPAARALEAGFAWCGVPFRIWSDPTDLAALIVVPFAWRLAAPRPPPSAHAQRPTRPSRAYEAVRVALGAIACVATSPAIRPPAPQPSQAFLANLTWDTIDVSVFRAWQPIDCPSQVGPTNRTLDASQFGPAVCLHLYPGQADALPPPQSGDAQGSACDAVVIRAPGLPDTLLSWGDIDAVTFDGSVLTERSLAGEPGVVRGARAEHVVFIERGAGRTFALGTTLISSENVGLPVPALQGCGDAGGTSDGGAPDGGGG
jgi:hypothetical protein